MTTSFNTNDKEEDKTSTVRDTVNNDEHIKLSKKQRSKMEFIKEHGAMATPNYFK